MKNFLAGIAHAGRELLGLEARHASAAEYAGLCRDLLKLKGEAAAIALADTVHATYIDSDASARHKFFEVLLHELEPDGAAVEAAYAAWRADPGPATLQDLNRASESARRELIRALNVAPGGTEALLHMRADLLDSISDDNALAPLDRDFGDVFHSWFNRGFLSLERIDWQTPAVILEKLIAYEAVHEIRGWDDLRRRLDGDRRCFAFFHPALPGEPLIFVQVALVRGLASNIEDLLAPADGASDEADTAVFYSISNCQRGLTGISFGNFLIKQVVDMLAAEQPALKHYATLSPVPGFRRWLEQRRTPDADDAVLPEKVSKRLGALDNPDWWRDGRAAARLAPVLRALCADYLLQARRGSEPLDPVARFHLRNGARLERINWLADTSPKGLGQSLGMMVNYVYEQKSVLGNHEAYVNEGKIAASAAVTRLAHRAG